MKLDKIKKECPAIITIKSDVAVEADAISLYKTS